MAGFVADASATLPWCFAEEATPAPRRFLVVFARARPPLCPLTGQPKS
jgi:hypothetical protein